MKEVYFLDVADLPKTKEGKENLIFCCPHRPRGTSKICGAKISYADFEASDNFVLVENVESVADEFIEYFCEKHFLSYAK